MPSCVLSICKCGITLSSTSKNAMPSRNPTAAGRNLSLYPFAISIDGISSDQTEAAIITPEAKPSSSFSSFSFILFFIRNTIAAPSVVPAKGINSPNANIITPSCYFFPTSSFEASSIKSFASLLSRNKPSVVSSSSTFS